MILYWKHGWMPFGIQINIKIYKLYPKPNQQITKNVLNYYMKNYQHLLLNNKYICLILMMKKSETLKLLRKHKKL